MNKKIKMSVADDNSIPKKNAIKIIKKNDDKLKTTFSNHYSAIKNDESNNFCKNIDLKSDNLMNKNNNKCVKLSEVIDTKKSLEKSNSKCINKSAINNNVKITAISGRRKKNIMLTISENKDNITINSKASSTTSKRQRIDSQKEGSPPPQPPSKIVKISEGVSIDNKKEENQTEQRVVTKPPLPPKPDKSVLNQIATVKASRIKRKLDENNAHLVQKLSAHAEQLRLEIGELKTALISEKNAVRVLRAQNETDSRRAKTESKKLQEVLYGQELKVKKLNREHEVHFQINAEQVGQPSSITTTVSPTLSLDNTKINQEIVALRDANKFLEEKIQISSDAEKRKIADIHELKDAYEIRLTQISKSAKSQIQRLLEELKTKERLNGQLKKEIELSKDIQKKEIRQAQHFQEMRKLKQIERSKCNTKIININYNNNDSNINNNNCIINNDNLTTCKKDIIKMAHDNEIPERIMEAHTELHILRNKDSIGSDSDSALSSAPPSLSPQPATCPNSPDVWRTFASKENELYEASQKELECLQIQNETLIHELSVVKNHIADLEKALFMTREGSNSSLQQYIEKIAYLEQREDLLIKEVHELREQNELNEFRIIELEESHDKWSLRSNLIPDTRDVWTHTERETEDIFMLSDRSDSGITSPQNQHHFDDQTTICQLEDTSIIEQMPSEDVRKRLSVMSKRNCYDDDDKLCLLQVLSLLNNLEALSQDHQITGEDFSIDLNMGRFKHSLCSETSTPRSLPDSSTNSPLRARHQARIVATVSPYSTVDNLCVNSLREDSANNRKSKFWTANNCSLQESGVFDGEQIDFISQCTQTDLEDFVLPVEKANGDLCAEIQKLNEFREKIEECVTKSSSKSPGVVNFLATDSCEQRRLQYYKDRLELLENKLLVYESTGDLQVRRLTERLQREIRLESLVKQLTEKCDKLQKDNLKLEEERCEFEEAENDTRLRLQRLEVDLDILNQRNVELEMSRDVAQAKLQDSRTHANCLEDTLHKCKDRLYLLEEHEIDLKRKLEMITTFMPAILLFNTWKTQEACKSSFKDSNRFQSANTPNCPCVESRVATSSYESPLQDQLHDMMRREKELTQNITELNRAYNETLENADNLWAQMEKEYKDKLANSEENECNLRCKLAQLEERLLSDSQFAQERISQLEESENGFKLRICKLNKENKDLSVKHNELLDEFHTLRDEYQKLKNYLEGPAADCLEKERRKVKELDEELILGQKMLHDVEEVHKNEILMIKNQLCKANKELIHIEVTNGELKEEVNTLELRLAELLKQRETDDETIKNLSQELISKESQLGEIKPKGAAHQSLAQELNTGPVKRVDLSGITDINTAAAKLAEALKNIEDCGNCFSHTPELKEVAKEVKELADSIVSRSIKKEKKSEDEVSDSKPPKPPGPPGPPGPSGSGSSPLSHSTTPPPFHPGRNEGPKSEYPTEESHDPGYNTMIKTEQDLTENIGILMSGDQTSRSNIAYTVSHETEKISVSGSASTRHLSKSSLISNTIDGSKTNLPEILTQDTEFKQINDEKSDHKTGEELTYNDNYDENEPIHETSSTYEVVVLPGAESGYEFASEHEFIKDESKLYEKDLNEISIAQDAVTESEHELVVESSDVIQKAGINDTISDEDKLLQMPINEEMSLPITGNEMEEEEKHPEMEEVIITDNVNEEKQDSENIILSIETINKGESTEINIVKDAQENIDEIKYNTENYKEGMISVTKEKVISGLETVDELTKILSKDIGAVKEKDTIQENEIEEDVEVIAELETVREITKKLSKDIEVVQEEKDTILEKEVEDVKVIGELETAGEIKKILSKDIEKEETILEKEVDDDEQIVISSIEEKIIEKKRAIEKELIREGLIAEVEIPIIIEKEVEEDEQTIISSLEEKIIDKIESLGKELIKEGLEAGEELLIIIEKEVEEDEQTIISSLEEKIVEKIQSIGKELIKEGLEAGEELLRKDKEDEVLHEIIESENIKVIEETKEKIIDEQTKQIVETPIFDEIELQSEVSSKEALVTKDHVDYVDTEQSPKLQKEEEILIGTSEIFSSSKVSDDSIIVQTDKNDTEIYREQISGDITEKLTDKKEIKEMEIVTSKKNIMDKATSTSGMSDFILDMESAKEMKPDIDKSPLDVLSSVVNTVKTIGHIVSSTLTFETDLTEPQKDDVLDLSTTSQEFTNVKSLASITDAEKQIPAAVTLSDVILKPVDFEMSPITSNISFAAITTDTDPKSDLVELDKGEKPLDLSVHTSLSSAVVGDLSEKEMDREHEIEKDLVDGDELQPIGDALLEINQHDDEPIDLSSTHGEVGSLDYPTLCLDKLISIIKEQVPPSPATSLAEKQLRNRFISDKDFRKDIEAIMKLSKQYVMDSLTRTNQDVLYCMSQANTEVDNVMKCIRAIQGYFSPLVSPQSSVVECADHLHLSGTNMICDVLCWQKRSNTRQEH